MTSGRYKTIWEFIPDHRELPPREIAHQWIMYSYREGLRKVPEDDDDLEDDFVHAEGLVRGFMREMYGE